MPKLWRALLGKPEERADPYISLADWYEQMTYQGLGYIASGSVGSLDTEQVENSFIGYINSLYKTNGIVFALMEARRSVFSEARFQFQRINRGRPGDLFGSPELKVLEYPWPNCTTGEMLSRAIQDVDLSGNHYMVREGNRLRRLRPDKVQILLSAAPDQAVQSDVIGYAYYPGGINNGTPKTYLPEHVAHWCPIPDPEAQYRGMSWLTPVLREIQADKQATDHKAKFYSNAATPKLSVSLKETVTRSQFLEFIEAFEAANGGVENAYKTMYLGGGADVSMVGANMVQLDFKAVQGAGETRIAAAAGVPPVVVGFSEGMQGSSLNAGNYKSAKESFGDRTLRPLWRSVSASYQSLVKMPTNSSSVRLWYDDRDIAFLRTDRLEAAKIMAEDSASVIKFVQGGFTPESSVSAVNAKDVMLLEHTGLVSVQLLAPGETPPGAGPPEGETPALPPGKEPPKALPPGQSNSSRWAVVNLDQWSLTRHGNLGDPGYHSLHPGSVGKGIRQNGRGAWLGSPRYTEEEHMEALNWYLNEGSYEMNSFLRDGSLPRGGTPEEAKRMTRILDDLISIQDPLEEDTEVFHGGPDMDLSEGDEFSDRGFISTTDEEGIADAFTLAYLVRDGTPGQTYTVTMPKGSRALSVWAIDPGIDNESEWIMPPGSTFRVDGDNGLRVVL